MAGATRLELADVMIRILMSPMYPSITWMCSVSPGEPHQIRPVAQRSISNRLGIPYPYLRRFPPDVQALNLNHWVTKDLNQWPKCCCRAWRRSIAHAIDFGEVKFSPFLTISSICVFRPVYGHSRSPSKCL